MKTQQIAGLVPAAPRRGGRCGRHVAPSHNVRHLKPPGDPERPKSEALLSNISYAMFFLHSPDNFHFEVHQFVLVPFGLHIPQVIEHVLHELFCVGFPREH
jgi:hypothetical protein